VFTYPQLYGGSCSIYIICLFVYCVVQHTLRCAFGFRCLCIATWGLSLLDCSFGCL